MGLSSLTEPVMLGIALGLFFGKQIGVFGSLWLAVALRLAPMPANANWAQLYGVAAVAGIGFTMSLFIGSLAFATNAYDAQIKLGVLVGSIASALTGYLILRQFAEPGVTTESERARTAAG
jgi:NhaA family Na+:H+ antiporter